MDKGVVDGSVVVHGPYWFPYLTTQGTTVGGATFPLNTDPDTFPLKAAPASTPLGLEFQVLAEPVMRLVVAEGPSWKPTSPVLGELAAQSCSTARGSHRMACNDYSGPSYIAHHTRCCRASA